MTQSAILLSCQSSRKLLKRCLSEIGKMIKLCMKFLLDWINFYQTWSDSQTHLSHIMGKPVIPYVKNKDTDQPVHSRSLISIFVVCSLDSKISTAALPKISRL